MTYLDKRTCVNVCVERILEAEVQIFQHRHVALHSGIYGIDQHGLLRVDVGEQVGVRRGHRLEELAEERRRGLLGGSE